MLLAGVLSYGAGGRIQITTAPAVKSITGKFAPADWTYLVPTGFVSF